jgi:hypothetical protein
MAHGLRQIALAQIFDVVAMLEQRFKSKHESCHGQSPLVA